MAENCQLLVAEPNEQITFYEDQSNTRPTTLKLSNPGSNVVHFKVMTTDPLAFCVKPKMGIVNPSETILIKIRLRRKDAEFKSDKPPKFKIFTKEDPERQFDPTTLWLKESSEQASSLKFLCVFAQHQPENAAMSDKEHILAETSSMPKEEGDSVAPPSEGSKTSSPRREVTRQAPRSAKRLLTIGSVIIAIASFLLVHFYSDTVVSLFS